jgi:NADPH-dependent ferric siderophore reductase
MTDDIDAIPTHLTHIVAARALTPGVRRLTFAGGLERYRTAGPDSFAYVLLPPPGRRELTIGTDFTWTSCFAMPEAERPVGAYYTVRHHRPEAGEIDIDVALHDHAGPAASWAATARAGDPVALWGPRTTYRPPGATLELLLVADATALPAVGAIVESLGSHQRARIVVEVEDEHEHQALRSPADLAVTWLHREGTPAGCSPALADAVRALPRPEAPTYVWGGGESRAMTEVRRHVRHTWGLPREQVSLTPYWRHADSPEPTPGDDE